MVCRKYVSGAGANYSRPPSDVTGVSYHISMLLMSGLSEGFHPAGGSPQVVLIVINTQIVSMSQDEWAYKTHMTRTTTTRCSIPSRGDWGFLAQHGSMF